MPYIINANCLSLPQQVEKNTKDIAKLFASDLKELTGLDFKPNSILYKDNTATFEGDFLVTRDETVVSIKGSVSLPLKGENGIVVDAGEDNKTIRIALDQADQELLQFVQELSDKTTTDNNIVFTNDMTNFVNSKIETALLNYTQSEVIYDADSNDVNLNWGYTSGIPSGTIVSDKNFSKYKKLIVIGYQAASGELVATMGSCEVDLRNFTKQYDGTTLDFYSGSNDFYAFNVTDTPNAYAMIRTISAKINSDKTNIKLYNVKTGRYFDNVNDGKIFRILGVF